MPKERIRDAGYFLDVTWGRGVGTVEVVVGTTVETDGAVGFAVHLDRSAANRLIRTLRRARDHAYGKDE